MTGEWVKGRGWREVWEGSRERKLKGCVKNGRNERGGGGPRIKNTNVSKKGRELEGLKGLRSEIAMKFIVLKCFQLQINKNLLDIEPLTKQKTFQNQPCIYLY